MIPAQQLKPSYETLESQHNLLRSRYRAMKMGGHASNIMAFLVGAIFAYTATGFSGVRWSIVQVLWTVCGK